LRQTKEEITLRFGKRQIPARFMLFLARKRTCRGGVVDGKPPE
jgi:hypothetical protein